MDSPTTHNGYFKFIADWLDEKYQQFEDAKREGRRKAVTEISKQLVAQTRNQIRSAKATWQPLRWCIRHKVTDAVKALKPTFHAAGLHKFVELTYPSHRLTLAHTVGDRLRLQATLKFLNDRADHRLSPRCYGNRPHGTRNCTDRRTAVQRFQRLVWSEGNAWVAKLDVRKFYDTLPHGPVLDALKAFVRVRGCVREIAGYLAWYWEQCWPGHAAPPANPVGLPQGSPVSGVLANIFMTSFDKALTEAGAEHIRYIDDITLVANSPEQLAEHLALAKRLIRRLGLQLAAGKTQVAYLGPGTPPQATLLVPGYGEPLAVHREFDLLGVHFYGDGRFRARHRTVNKLLSRVWRIIYGKGDHRSALVRYISATATINRMLGYHVGVRRPGTKAAQTKPETPRRRAPTRALKARLHSSTNSVREITIRRAIYVTGRVWIGGMRFVQPRQHALLGYSPLVAAQMHRVDELIGRWMRQKFATALAAANLPPGLVASLRNRRVRSAVKMYEMAAREPPPECPNAEA
jgi:hypothetical protein